MGEPTMKLIKRWWSVIFLGWWVGVTGGLEGAESRPPNIVFFLVDDLGIADIGAFNPNTFYETPNVDRLAAGGMRFTQAYAACQVCSPTRASILTGLYPQRLGITDFISPAGNNQPEKWTRNTRHLPAPYQDHLALEAVTLPELLKTKGYATFFAGKWHLGAEGFYPEDQGFDFNFGGIDQGGPYGGKKYFSPYGNPRLADGPDGEHLPDRLARETVRFIKDHRDEPFLAYLSFYSVHTPLIARPDLVAKYEAKRKTLGLEAGWGVEGPHKVRLVQEHAVYAGMVEAMDQAVGWVLDGLDELGLAENTIVVFTSDNGGLSTSEGWPTSNLPFRGGKGWIYEGGIREPTIVRWPGVTPAGQVNETMVTSPDWVPTLVEAAGVTVPMGVDFDGVSLLPAWRGAEQSRGPIFWHYPHYGNQGGFPSGSVRDGDWKLLENYDDGSVELYNLKTELSEQYDQSASQSDLVSRLQAQLRDWRGTVGARMPTVNPAFNPAEAQGR
jgi:arylsulfatase A-like enzyme